MSPTCSSGSSPARPKPSQLSSFLDSNLVRPPHGGIICSARDPTQSLYVTAVFSAFNAEAGGDSVPRLYIQDLFIADYRSDKLARLMVGLPHAVILSKSVDPNSWHGLGPCRGAPSPAVRIGVAAQPLMSTGLSRQSSGGPLCTATQLSDGSAQDRERRLQRPGRPSEEEPGYVAFPQRK